MFPIRPIGTSPIIQPMPFDETARNISAQYWSPVAANCEGPSGDELGVKPIYDPSKLLAVLEKEREEQDKADSDIIAYVLATCTAYAYSDAPTLSRAMTGIGLQKAKYVVFQEFVDAMSIWSTAFVVQSPTGKSAILCYRGTVPLNLNSWLADLDVGAKRFPFYESIRDGDDPTVHAGFYRNVEGTLPAIAQVLTKAIEGKSILTGDPLDPAPAPAREGPALKQLYITGHSLGGAMAVLAAAALKSNPAYQEIADTPVSVYTYAQPMVGNEAFGERFMSAADIPLRRYIYRRDIIPRLPSLDVVGEFAHFGNEAIHLAPENEAGRIPPTREEAKQYLAEVVDNFAEQALMEGVRNEIRDLSRLLNEINRSLVLTVENALAGASRAAIQRVEGVIDLFRRGRKSHGENGVAGDDGNGAARAMEPGVAGGAGQQAPIVQRPKSGNWPPPVETILDFVIAANVTLLEKFRNAGASMPYCSLADHFPNFYVDALKPPSEQGRAGDRFEAMLLPQ